MPMGDGTYCLGVLKSIQEAAGVGLGDEIDIELELDTAAERWTFRPTWRRRWRAISGPRLRGRS
jgi:hypothetical protein